MTLKKKSASNIYLVNGDNFIHFYTEMMHYNDAFFCEIYVISGTFKQLF